MCGTVVVIPTQPYSTSIKGCWNRELVVCSHELRTVEESSEGVQESL